MSVRKRTWGGEEGKAGEAWVVDFTDAAGKRRMKTFRTKREADQFHDVVRAVGSGHVPEPLTSGYRPIEFSLPLPPMWKKGQIARQMIADAMQTAHPKLNPTTEAVIAHVVAEMAPAPVVADVDNLLKPVLEALKGIAWVDDTQVCEVLCRRLPATRRLLRVKIWQIPGPLFSAHLNALAALGNPATATRPSIALASGSLPAQKANSGSSSPATAGSRPLANISQGGLQPAMVAAGLFVVIGEPGPETGEVGRKAKYTGMHALRHFFASWCINRKVDGGQELPPKNVQGLMGHETIDITMDTYGHLFPRKDGGTELAEAEKALLGRAP